jgi:hypothetical protein
MLIFPFALRNPVIWMDRVDLADVGAGAAAGAGVGAGVAGACAPSNPAEAISMQQIPEMTA